MSSEGITTLQRNEDKLNNKNHNYFLMLFLLLKLIISSLQDSAIFCLIWSYWQNNLFSTISLMFSNISRTYFSFLTYKTLRKLVALFFSNFFQLSFFGWVFHSILVIFIYKGFNFSYSLRLFFYFFMI